MNQDVKKIKIEDYNYPLPDERIARFPLEERDSSKLLISFTQEFQQSSYSQLVNHLPEDSFLLFNETKVVQARLLFPKNETTTIEIFCLEPAGHLDIQQAMAQKKEIIYQCLIGGARKWKSGLLELKTHHGSKIFAEKLENLGGTFLVKFSWTNELSFAEVLEEVGKTPLPPYLNRKAEQSDKDRYQTVFAKVDGSVAAPTASLHFTDKLLQQLKEKNIGSAKLTLHVGAGTFKPVDSEEIEGHEMHAEEFMVNRNLLQALKLNLNKTIIPVGTTSMRALESIYWLGCQAFRGELKKESVPFISQWCPYEEIEQISTSDSLKALINYFEANAINHLMARTAIIIAPSYSFRFCKGLITNFHQPKSTLLLLVSALMGEKWRAMYQYALQNDFRFLSYGDGCLILDNVKESYS